MPNTKFLFIDFDNTLSDLNQFLEQYVRETSSFLAPRYGGSEVAWAQATLGMIQALEQDYKARFVGNPLAGYCAWLEEARAKASEWLFQGVGLPLPANPYAVTMDVQFQGLSACNATYPGAAEAMQTLFEQDYRVQVASGNDSEYLLAALLGAGIESFMESKFGPDLIDCAKEGPEYYERIFAASEVSAADTLVIDDHPDAIRWALQTGTKVIQAKMSPNVSVETIPGVVAVMTDLRELPGLVQQVLG